MKLYIIATLYHSKEYINELCERVKATVCSLVGNDYEIVLVNDGSPYDCFDIAKRIDSSDHRAVVDGLSRNFGHDKAILTGLEASSVTEIFLIDSDLAERPELCRSFRAQMRAEGSNFVHGVQSTNKGCFFEKTSSALCYRIFGLCTGSTQPSNIVTARLISRYRVDSLLLHQEREINIGGLWIITGCKRGYQFVEKLLHSLTTYSISHKISHLVNAIKIFSSLALVVAFYAGRLVPSFSAIYRISLANQSLFMATSPDGYTSRIILIWLLAGMIILFIGVQGIHISKVFSEVKRRPTTILRGVFNINFEK